MKRLKIFLLLMIVIISSTGCSIDGLESQGNINEMEERARVPELMSIDMPESIIMDDDNIENSKKNEPNDIKMAKLKRAPENKMLADIIGKEDFKVFEENVLTYLGDDFKDIIREKGLQSDVIEMEGLKFLRYDELGVDFGYDTYSNEILVIMPSDDKEVFGIKMGDTVSKVQETLGYKDYIIDYAKGYGRLAMEYRAGDYDLRVVYNLGKVCDINIVYGGLAGLTEIGEDVIYNNNENIIIEDEKRINRDKVTGEEITIYTLLDNMNMAGEDMIYSYGYYDGSFAGEMLFEDRFSYIYSELGVVFVGDLNQSDVNLVVFYNREALEIKKGMSKEEVIKIHGKPIKEELSKIEGGKHLYRLVYSKEVKGREFEFSVYLDGNEGNVYFTTFGLWDR